MKLLSRNRGVVVAGVLALLLVGCSKEKPGQRHVERSTRDVGGMKVSIVKISGIYLAPGGPMMESQGKKENYRLLGAIVEGPEGSVFFKTTGPAATISAAEESFNALIASLAKTEPGAEPAAGSAVAGIRWTVPVTWSEQPPRPMRVATYMVPAASGDPEGGECAVFYFGNDQGGGIEANIERWVGQFENSAGAQK